MKKTINYFILPGFIILSFLFYRQALGIYFLSDDLTQIHIMSKFGMGGITHNFDIAFLRPLPYVFMALLHNIFGHDSATPYHTWNIVVHAINSYLIYVLYMAWMKRHSLPAKSIEGITAGLLFLTLPYQTEAVTWVAATVDLMVTTFILATIILFINYKTEGRKRYLYASVIVFFLALMSKEACLFIPVLIFVMEAIDYFPHKKFIEPFKTTLLYGSWFPAYILMRYYFLGELIGGYHEVHTQFNPLLIGYNAALYTAKFFAFYRLLPNELKDILKYILQHKIILWTCLSALVLFIFYFRNYFIRLFINPITITLILSFYISLIPVINLETSFIGSSQSDRYGYVPSVFFILLFTYLLYSLVNKKIVTILISALLIWFYFGANRILNNWQAGSVIAEGVLKNFKQPQHTAYILNLPDNINGTYMLRTGFSDGISLLSGKDFSAKIKVLSYHTIANPNDSVWVSTSENNSYKIKLPSSKNRFYFTAKLFVHNPHPDLYTISEFSDTGFTVKFEKLDAADKLYYYTSGKLIALN